MIQIDVEAPGEAGARELLLDRTMGPDRHLKSSERLRENRLPASGLALVARDGDEIVGTVRLWNVSAGGRDALLLGPLAIAPERQGEGIGGKLMRAALNRAAMFGHGAVILVGDLDYYARFGFATAATQSLMMPGPVERKRFLALELQPGALDGASGMLVATGDWSVPPLAARDFPLVARPRRLDLLDTSR
ncbi:GNAT family N-acetyltransferase [Kaistia nematophila]|uniref:N-acetyltransferase n=1 Tax=Kaistia nematophila TaxID=2994654 RepID=A0A9X3EFJ9_9HYPH|nr:N-acetyltransferase [Kaistia nematophila]MCX5572305.1 N-acetyltransferase [Kaistia nematophila]